MTWILLLLLILAILIIIDSILFNRALNKMSLDEMENLSSKHKTFAPFSGFYFYIKKH